MVDFAVALRRMTVADFKERAESLKRKVKSAMIYPIVVVLVAVGILTFIMIKIVPVFRTIFEDFEVDLPPMTEALIFISNAVVDYWFMIPGIPILVWLFVKVIRKFDFYEQRLSITSEGPEDNTFIMESVTLVRTADKAEKDSQ